MDPTNIEESTSLTESSKQRRVDSKSPRSMLQYNREKRIRLIRLKLIYYVSWILFIILSWLIPPYLYFLMPKPDCWHARNIQVKVSLVLAISTSFFAFILLIAQCLTRVKTTLCRRNFCRFTFTMFTLFAVVHFVVAIYFFSMFSCYFDQSTPDAVISENNDWLTNLAIRYDLKIAGIIHLIISLLALFTGVGFAVIKNNFKYVLVVDVD